jgi:glycosyltransferase involved in cell wall biosynthesis
MIYLQPEVRSGLGEDTFWTWFARTVPGCSFDLPSALQPDDVVLQYSTLGPCRVPGGKKVALLWELYPEMRARLGGPQWDRTIDATRACAAESDYRVVSSEFSREFYADCGPIDVLPIGVDTELFRPMHRNMVRARHGIPDNVRVGFWCGTGHPMKGSDALHAWAAAHPDVRWIIVWKTSSDRGVPPLNTVAERTLVPQPQLAELMNCADFVAVPGRLRPFFMVEWEAMACDLPVIVMGEPTKDFTPRPCGHVLRC